MFEIPHASRTPSHHLQSDVPNTAQAACIAGKILGTEEDKNEDVRPVHGIISLNTYTYKRDEGTKWGNAEHLVAHLKHPNVFPVEAGCQLSESWAIEGVNFIIDLTLSDRVTSKSFKLTKSSGASIDDTVEGKDSNKLFTITEATTDDRGLCVRYSDTSQLHVNFHGLASSPDQTCAAAIKELDDKLRHSDSACYSKPRRRYQK
ncbi:hypothetical protein J3R83DRAFT_10188 [Lanmaoa asiatica]|nr:hypothetical protein J3R83DRAFT_10188 [Lanmaoa asiatica]